MTTYVIVAFRVDSTRSILYRKVVLIDKLYLAIKEAFIIKGADFISIRKVE